MKMLSEAGKICDLLTRKGLIPRSHAGIKGFMISFKAYGQYDPLSYRNKIPSKLEVAPNALKMSEWVTGLMDTP